MDDSAIICDEIIESDAEANSYNEEAKTFTKNITCKTRNLYILFGSLLITIALMIDVTFYYYLIKYRAKQKHVLPFHVTNNKLKQVLY